MNLIKQRIKIAEICGWKDVHWYEDNAGPDILSGTPPRGSWQSKVTPYPNSHVPDYLSSLDNMHLAEKTIKSEQQKRLYVDYLVCEMKPGQFTVMATAKQRAAAFIKYHNDRTKQPTSASTPVNWRQLI